MICLSVTSVANGWAWLLCSRSDIRLSSGSPEASIHPNFDLLHRQLTLTSQVSVNYARTGGANSPLRMACRSLT